MKKTPWFSWRVKPVHPGVYETNLYECPGWYAYWNGRRWGMAKSTALAAQQARSTIGAHQEKGWRGLTTKDGK